MELSGFPPTLLCCVPQIPPPSPLCNVAKDVLTFLLYISAIHLCALEKIRNLMCPSSQTLAFVCIYPFPIPPSLILASFILRPKKSAPLCHAFAGAPGAPPLYYIQFWGGCHYRFQIFHHSTPPLPFSK